MVWWFSKRHFDLVQVCDWLFRNKCLYICRCRKHAHNCYPLTLWGWLLLVVIWTWEISGSELKERTVWSLVKMYAMLYCFITYASFSTVSRVADTVGYTANELWCRIMPCKKLNIVWLLWSLKLVITPQRSFPFFIIKWRHEALISSKMHVRTGERKKNPWNVSTTQHFYSTDAKYFHWYDESC